MREARGWRPRLSRGRPHSRGAPQTRPHPPPRSHAFWVARTNLGPAPPRTTRRDWAAAAELGSWGVPLTAAPGATAILNPGRKRVGS